MRVLILCVAMAVLSGCQTEAERAATDAAQELWRGAVVVKICRNGTHVYRLRDGRHFTGGLFNQSVDNPETVCG